jgi:protein-tyrosine-phosphatase
MAEGLFRQKLVEEGMDRTLRVASAGVWAVDDAPASENAVTVMSERGIDISGHIAHTITAADVSEADLILVMSREHAEMIENTWPQYQWKVHRLAEMSGKRKDISDPYRGSLKKYRSSANIISDYIDQGFQQILRSV